MTTLHRPRIFAGALVAAAAVVAVAAPVSAHNYLVSSTPEVDGVITELPDRFEITTNDQLLDLGDGSDAFVLRVSDSDGLFYGDGCVDVDGPTMSTPAALGAAGPYTVDWQIVSIDGHPVADSFVFDWQPSDAATATEGSVEPPECGVEPEPSASASPSDDAGADAQENGASPEQSAEPSTPPVSPTTATDSLSTVLWVGGAVLLLATIIGLAVKFLRSRRRERE